jgi:hypothetical protein
VRALVGRRNTCQPNSQIAIIMQYEDAQKASNSSTKPQTQKKLFPSIKQKKVGRPFIINYLRVVVNILENNKLTKNRVFQTHPIKQRKTVI